MHPTNTANTNIVTRGVWCRYVAISVAFLVGMMTCQLGFAQTHGTARPRPKSADHTTTAPKPLPPEPASEEEPAPTQEYKELQVDETKDGPKKNVSKVAPILTAGKFGDGEKEMFDEYYQNYFLPRWSLVKNIGTLPQERKKLRDNLAKRSVGGSAAVHDRLNELVLDSMKTLVAGDFHPAGRINAMLMIGDLNRTDAAGSQKAVPLPEAFKFLLASVENPKLSDAIRVEAMVGILRHANAGIQDDVQPLTAVMLRLATADLPTGPTASGCAWIRRQAIETLGALGSVGNNNAVFQAILKSVADDKLPSFVRSAAADSLGQLNYSSATGISPVETAATLGQYAIDVCDEELRLVKKPVTQVWRRQALQRLAAVLSALSGAKDASGAEDANHKGIISLAKDPNQQAYVDELQKAIKEACESLDDKDQDDKSMKAVVQELQKKLKASLEKKPK